MWVRTVSGENLPLGSDLYTGAPGSEKLEHLLLLLGQWRVQGQPPGPRPSGVCAQTDLQGRGLLAVRRGLPVRPMAESASDPNG